MSNSPSRGKQSPNGKTKGKSRKHGQESKHEKTDKARLRQLSGFRIAAKTGRVINAEQYGNKTNTEWLGKAANTWGVLYAEQYSAICARKSMVYVGCVIVFRCERVISEMAAGKCSPG